MQGLVDVGVQSGVGGAEAEWLAVLWKQRDRRREEFTVQHERVEMLYSSANPYA
ncbi:hypothetical protein [Micromonospora sp. MH33]|uniref:hypothetical protein n=1 Tax=Micromonospora sp. MH33 TaxID=1945509 RepID=UPI001FEF6465|nr:hypothetical protein [Micromonospora sp. MH33]